MNAQENQKEIVWMKDYNILFNGYLTSGKNMTHESHQDFGLGIEYKMGIFQYHNIGISAVFNYSSHQVDQIQMIGLFEKTNYFQAGGALKYNWVINDQHRLKPEFAILGLEAIDKGYSKKATYNGVTYRIGTDYIHQLSDKLGFVIGLHYNITQLDIKANPAYEDYFRQANRFQLNLGLNFR